tara:strand:- start:175 stop:660 length:486 start_codon:yes stop_codon:yes gene_type:complete
MASKKQIAARKKFAKIMKSGGFKKRKTSTRKTKTVKKTQAQRRKTSTTKRKTTTLKRAKRKAPVMRRKSSRRSSAKRGLTSVFKGGLLGKAAAGIGAATVLGLIVNNFAPQFTSVSNIAGGYLGGGAVGAIAALAVNGGLGNLGGLFGGSSSGVQPQVMGV